MSWIQSGLQTLFEGFMELIWNFFWPKIIMFLVDEDEFAALGDWNFPFMFFL